MDQKKTVRKRDIYLVAILMVFFGAMFFIFQFVLFAGDAVSAYIYYGTGDPLVTIDFTSEEIIVNMSQEVPDGYSDIYPYINENGDEGYIEVTVLGDYKIDGVRQEVVIAIDFIENRIKVKSEESPLNICSKQGWSTAVPLICLPNRVRVEFDSTSSNLDFIQ